jgi:hypothetical protein
MTKRLMTKWFTTRRTNSAVLAGGVTEDSNTTGTDTSMMESDDALSSQAKGSSLSSLDTPESSQTDTSSKLYSTPASSTPRLTIEPQTEEDLEASRRLFSKQLWTKLERHRSDPNGTWRKELAWTHKVHHGKPLLGEDDVRRFFENTGYEIFELEDEDVSWD